MKSGTCKYGAAYKFDHPGEVVAKDVAMVVPTTEDALADYDKIDSGKVGTKATNEIIKD